jgi:hypothetical protein
MGQINFFRFLSPWKETKQESYHIALVKAIVEDNPVRANKSVC